MTTPRFGRRPIPNRLPNPRPVPPSAPGATDAEPAHLAALDRDRDRAHPIRLAHLQLRHP